MAIGGRRGIGGGRRGRSDTEKVNPDFGASTLDFSRLRSPIASLAEYGGRGRARADNGARGGSERGGGSDTTVIPDFGSSTLDFPSLRPPQREMGGGSSVLSGLGLQVVRENVETPLYVREESLSSERKRFLA